MAEVGVCKDNWNGVKNEQFTWNNSTGQNVTFTQDGNNTWPFTLQPGFTVPAKSKLNCGLIGVANTYQYNSGPCTSEGNPKTVVIG